VPDRYELVIARRFYKDLRQIDPQDQERILEALRQMGEEPYKGRKVVVAETGQYRWRVGPYRIRCDIERDEVHVLRVRHRREAY
jgi:mRNA-degrading endonuclease RelE of RelBE toxin-antitoxin system